MKVCFAGDVFLGGDLLDKSCDDLVTSTIFRDADIRVINLEQPISDNNYVEDKCTLYTGSYALKQLKALKIDAVNLAHNHIQDKGLSGIHETIVHLSSVGIKSFGAGESIQTAEKPYFLTEKVSVMGYCEFDKPYLQQVAVAEGNRPGINPLRLGKILSDLNNLPAESKAVIYFHWGMEHSWLPTAEDIGLAKKLLEDERVITIIGMHSHRVQGVINHAGKKAYMCLGNFIFPNFYIDPPVQISYPSEAKKKVVKYQTRQYHHVYELTYKKWRWVNRVSLILDFCSDSHELKHSFVVQNDDNPNVNELRGMKLFFYNLLFKLLSVIYKLPKPLYSILWEIHAFEVKLSWQIQIAWFHFKQLGMNKFFKEFLRYVRKKLSK
jgi:hypothetical protein